MIWNFCCYSNDSSAASFESLAKDEFQLTKWLSNDRKVLAEIPETERAVFVVNLAIQQQQQHFISPQIYKK